MTIALAHVVTRNASSRPDSLAVVAVEGGRVTWAELDDLGRRWAAGLRALGVAPGDLVATMLPNNIDGALGWLGVAAAGAIEVPVNHYYVATWLFHVLSDTGATVAIVDRRFWAQWEPVVADTRVEVVVIVGGGAVPTSPNGVRVVALEAVLDGVAPIELAEEPSPLDTACIVYTSGSSSSPMCGRTVARTQFSSAPWRTFCGRPPNAMTTPTQHRSSSRWHRCSPASSSSASGSV